ncbi:MAG TPA: beta-propeller fold lactonase family protein [Polyangiaceae bacterium]|nr:beta-propeller fold lactonase family protein [Polyangiaceae bacterium]
MQYRMRRSPFEAIAFAPLVLVALACDLSSSRQADLMAPGPKGAERLVVLVSNEASNDISFIDAASGAVLRSLPVGKRPRGMKVSVDGSKLYVALSGSPRGGPNVDESQLPPPDRSEDGIGVLDLSGLSLGSSGGTVTRVAALQSKPASALQAKLTSGNDPETIDATPDGLVLAVANEDSAQVRLIQADNGALLATIAVGLEPEGLRFRPDGRVLYVTSEANDRLDVIDVGERRVIATLPVGQRPRNILFDPEGEHAYVACELAGRVDVIDARAHRPLTSIEIEGTPRPMPMGMALDPSERRLYVSLGRAGEVAVIDVRSLRLLQRIEGVGARPWGIALTPDGRKIYTANGPSGDVSVIDAKTLRVTQRIQVGQQPWGISLVRVRGS